MKTIHPMRAFIGSGPRAYKALSHKARTDKGKKLAQLAEVSESVISNWKLDKNGMKSEEEGERLALLTGVPARWILWGQGPGPDELDPVNPPARTVDILTQSRQTSRHPSGRKLVKQVQCIPWEGEARTGLLVTNNRFAPHLTVEDGAIFDPRMHEDRHVVRASKDGVDLIAIYDEGGREPVLIDAIGEAHSEPVAQWKVEGVLVEVVRGEGDTEIHIIHRKGLKIPR